MVLHRLGIPLQALEQIDILLRDDPTNRAYREFKASALGRIGDYAQAIADYEAILATDAGDTKSWLLYGHLLKTAGRTQDAMAAYRKSIALHASGEGWWSLANLKTVVFTDADIIAMQSALDRGDAADRAHFHFALGAALESRRDYASAFAHYTQGNSARRSACRYDPNEMSDFVARAEQVFTSEFFAARAGSGCPAADPIFVVGLPRSGSTLVEQILASHPQIEGTMELADMPAIARAVRGTQKDYPAAIAALPTGSLRDMGENYLARTQAYRRLGRAFFIDKMPNNFIHIALIHLILPNARFIDVRRDPLDCCVSVFKQNFAAGQEFSYDLQDIGRYYAGYVRLMAHFDAVLPGRVHRVVYEDLVANPEREMRRLFDYCKINFVEESLRFHENKRPVRTASSEQVRRPIFSDSIGSWRHFAPWLDPLKAALGPELDRSGMETGNE